MSFKFQLQGAELVACSTGALWWPEARLLTVADLHLGRAERLARRGGTLLPPYDTMETLARLEAAVLEFDPRTVVCLGDSFDDLAAAHRLEDGIRARLSSLLLGRRWVWVEGNHDPGDPQLGGTHMAELARGPLTFRHIAHRTGGRGEVSGHFHPKMSLTTRAGRITRPCFLRDRERLILPAFGAYTGGLDARDPALTRRLGLGAEAILTGPTPVRVPLGPTQQTA
ncbi:MAG: ligase-associated DNA damage response endonuclease PdeM [Pseudomonadota bacterium]